MTIWIEALRRAELVAAGAVLARRGLICGREGNLSCRFDDGAVLVTPRGADKGRLVATDLVRCRLAEPAPAGASSEAAAHLAVYRACPGVNALVHAHPRRVLALAALGRLPDPGALEEGTALVPRIERVPAVAPGSLELAAACARAIERAPAAVLARHGVLCAGDDVWRALERVEVLESLAAVALAAVDRTVTI
ncbi:MAG: class II aldolase/adducin family protein [Acidobacteria bacterium]|nr:MAG: class II aldolase/adducin family protein [Acidobacteriota bacterium]